MGIYGASKADASESNPTRKKTDRVTLAFLLLRHQKKSPVGPVDSWPRTEGGASAPKGTTVGTYLSWGEGVPRRKKGEKKS